MQVEIMSHTQQKVVLHLKKASVPFANTLRRAVIGRLPCFAISEADFYENNSPFYNEYLANRLGLIPLTFDPDASPDAKISLTLNAQGPGMTYSRDLTSSDEKIKPLNGDFPIADLAEGQQLRLEAWATFGNPNQHARFQCAIASYTYYPEFSLKKGAALKEFTANLPKSVLDADGNILPWHAELAEEFLEKHPDQGELKYKQDEFIFFVESYNNVDALEHFKKALGIIKKEAAEARKQV
ncbi:MAG: DNA-directed RNA polymerase subunit D [Candidatus Micrarchaeota archaeon]